MFPHIWVLNILIVCFTGSVQNANILGVFPFPGFSHFIMFRRLMEELAKRGHTVHVVSHFPLEKSIPGYNDISIRGILPLLTEGAEMNILANLTPHTSMLFMMETAGEDICKITLESQVMKDLRNSNNKYDLFITEIFGAECMFGFGHHFNVPTVAVTSSVDIPWGANRIGNPDNPSYIPSYFMPFNSEMTLFDRLKNTVNLIHSKVMHYIYVQRQDKYVKKFFGEDTPHVDELLRNVSLLLVNSHFSLNQARPLVPNLVEVAGLHVREPESLNQHLKNIIEVDREIIYFSLGSFVLSETIPLDKLQSICDAFKELPYKILWKANQEKFPKELVVPDNVQFEGWVPQLDILCHPNVKLFISHGGLMGSQEAIHCGIPILGIPLFGDQALNIRTFVDRGFALRIKYEEISKENILSAVKEILDNPSYKENAESQSKQFNDRPLNAVETAIYWVEYVIRYNGAPQLKSYASHLYWYQYYLVDVALIPIFIVISFVMLYKLLLRKFRPNICTKHKSS